VNSDEQRKLLRWARETIEATVAGRTLPQIEPTEVLCSPHAAFVTLKKHHELRGCIGMMDFARPLWENVQHAAVASALHDPRFPPVIADELPELRLEISALQPPRPIESFEDFEVGRHGIILELGRRHGLFLPQVAPEQGWDREKTLEMLCYKAGLPPDAWLDPAARLSVFEAEVFSED
jgi:AmmeMemoRadiSam system protein A